MASVTWQGLSGFVASCVAAVQAAANAVIDATVGSVTLAWSQAIAGAALFLQGQAAQVTALTRLATSFDGDADSFVDQFGMERLGPTYATTTESFARFTATNAALIPAGSGAGADLAGGAIVSTGPGGIQFMVAADATNPLWNGDQNGYLVPANTSSANVPVQCLTPGTAGNVLAGTITSFFTPIAGIDTCTNAADVGNGLDAETDPALKVRFPIYLQGLSSANYAAIVSGVMGVQQGLSFLPIENYDYPGTSEDPGSFFIVVDDGSHDPPAALKQAVYDAIDLPERGFCIRFQGVYGPSPTTINLNGTITVANGYNPGQVVEAVDAAWTAWIDGFWPGWLAGLVPQQPIVPASVTIAAAASVAMGVPGVVNIDTTTIEINGANDDLALTIVQAPTPGAIAAAHT